MQADCPLPPLAFYASRTDKDAANSPSRRFKVPCCGGCRFTDGVLAHVHPAVQRALRNHVFDSLGLPRLHIASCSST
jgi:hypothetical protein